MSTKKIARPKKQIEELTARLEILKPESYLREQDFMRAGTLIVGRRRGAYPEYKLPDSDV